MNKKPSFTVFRKQMYLNSYQEARRVVQQAAEAADEASLQKRGVLGWKLVRVVAHQERRGRRLTI